MRTRRFLSWATLQCRIQIHAHTQHPHLLSSHSSRHAATYMATHCNSLEHTATHCNTLQHTATHCHTLRHLPSSHLTRHAGCTPPPFTACTLRTVPTPCAPPSLRRLFYEYLRLSFGYAGPFCGCTGSFGKTRLFDGFFC